jgi:chorismate dehydratase
VYGAIDRGVVSLNGTVVTGVPSALNKRMADGTLDISVVSAVEYARDARRYLLLPDLAISCDGPVQSVMLFAKRPAEELDGKRVIVSRSSMTSVALLELLFENVWHARPEFVAGDAEMSDIASFDHEQHDARLVIGDAALVLRGESKPHVVTGPARDDQVPSYPFAYDLGRTWKEWTGLPFVFAVWVAQRTAPVAEALGIHASLITSRNWGLEHLPTLATQASEATGVSEPVCLAYLSGLDYGLSYEHLAGLTEFFRRLVAAGRVPNGTLAFLPAA